MNVSSGDTINGVAENLSETESTYAIEVNGSAVAPTVDTKEAAPVSVDLSCEGNGRALGSGTVYTGESVRISAVPFEGEDFLGWYENGTLVSSETEYDMLASQDIDLSAKFTENTCEITVSDGNDIISAYRINKGGTVPLEENPRKTKGIFKGYFADENFTRKFDKNTTFNTDSTIYAEFESAKRSGDWFYFVNNDGNAVIAGRDNCGEVLRIPSEIDGHTVTSIYFGAFNAESDIKSAVLPNTINVIDDTAFMNCEMIKTVCYDGSKDQWNSINIGENNEALTSAKLVANFDSDYDADISQISVDSGTVTANLGFTLRDGEAYCALYDSSGVLAAVKQADAAAGDEQIKFDISDVGKEFETLKIFIWESETLKPLSIANVFPNNGHEDPPAPTLTPAPTEAPTALPPRETEQPGDNSLKISVRLDKTELAPGESAVVSLIADRDFETDLFMFDWTLDNDFEFFDIDENSDVYCFPNTYDGVLSVFIGRTTISVKAGEPFYSFGIKANENARKGRHSLPLVESTVWDTDINNFDTAVDDIVIDVK